MKKVLIISTTLRQDGNSDILAKEFARGSVEAGNCVDIVSLRDKNLAFCKGCLGCQKTGKCVIKDDAIAIAEKAKESEVIVFATPVYYYEMSGQMKTLLDRLNPLFASDYAFGDIYLIGTAADEESNALDGTINGIKGWISCFKNARLSGVVYGTGATDCGDVKRMDSIMNQAYEMGKQI